MKKPFYGFHCTFVCFIAMGFMANQSVANTTNKLILQVHSNEIIVKGKVLDSDNKPLNGVTVSVIGSSKAVTTNENGTYEIKANSDASLKFSYVGYQTITEKINNRTSIDIILTANSSTLSDVVVVGYGTAKKKDLTGSIGQLNKDSYKNQPILSTTQALQGRVAGVMVSNNSGAPGGEVKVRVRGSNSVNNSNNPLVVVDGIELGVLGLQNINPDDIESTEVLKDASSTAIYGARGANGVLLITTKKGRSGKLNINLKTFASNNSPIRKYDLMSPQQYAGYANVLSNGQAFPNGFAGPGTNMQSKIFNTTQWTQNVQASASGGNEKVKFYVSGIYQDQPGLLINSNYSRFGLRNNLNIKLSDKFTADIHMYFERDKKFNVGDLGYKGNPVTASIAWDPTKPIYVDNDPANGYLMRTSSPIWPNPYMILKESYSQSIGTNGITNINLSYEILPGLKVSTNNGIDFSMVKGGNVSNLWISQGNIKAAQNYTESFSYINSNIINYNKKIQKHEITLTGVYENYIRKSSGFVANSAGLPSAVGGFNRLGLGTSQSILSNYSNNGIVSFLGRMNYNYDDRYLVTASIRRDGSSKFQGNNQWATFPSIGLAWNIINEGFMKNQKIFSDLRFRAGYGLTGNENIAPYSTQGVLTQGLYSYGSTTAATVLSLGNPPTPNVHWEISKQTNLGLDASFLKNKLNVTLDYYEKSSKGLLLLTNIKQYEGGGAYLKNVGNVSNKGFEASISYQMIHKSEFNWNSQLVFGFNKNKVESLGPDQIIFRPFIGGGLITTQIQAIQVGQPLGSFYLIPWEGVYQHDDPALGFKAGDNKYKDVNGDKKIDYSDRVISGSAMPKATLGFNNTFTFKGFELNIFIQGAYGQKVFNATYAGAAVPTSDVKYPTLSEVTNYWTPTNGNNTWANPTSNTTKRYIESTQFLQDGSYTRLKNVSLAYNFPSKMLKNYTLKVFASAQNLYTITKYKGFDPENSSTSGSSDADAGIDLGAYPTPKTITFGINVGFGK